MNPVSRSAWKGLVLVALACGGPKPGEALLTISAKPGDINDRGEVTVIKVVALDGFGKVGKGKITITSDSGSLKDGPTFDVDAYGQVTTPFSCSIADDMYCKGVVTVSARWISEQGERVSADTRVTITPPPPPPWEADVIWDSAASAVSCSGMAPASAMPCVGNMCPHGFSCVEGACVLNGGGGGLQYTLRFGQSVDLDLHVVDPVPDGGVCEVYYGDRNNAQGPSQCGSAGSLDLDSNAACSLDNVNIENVIYPQTANLRPRPGTYIARVDLWSACTATTPITYELQVRAGAMNRYYCGEFTPAMADRGGRMSGRLVSTITIP